MYRHASMNRTYSLVWSVAQQAYVVAPEIARQRGKRATLKVVAAAVATIFSGGLAHALDPGALPGGGAVTAGQAAIGVNGNTMTIEQGTNKTAINWQSFNVGSGAQVNFVQPSSNAVALNRVVGQDASQIMGSLRANGQVFILNPNGVMFAPGAQVSAAGVMASTRNISNEDFMAGKLTFSGNSTGKVVNQGTITAADGGYVVLVGAQVRNTGTINATKGDVRLAAANQVSVQIDGAGLTSFTVDQGTLDALAENQGLIKADGGRIFLTADALNQLAKATVNNTGVIEAHTVENRDGVIVLKGDMQHGTAQVGGTLDASAPNGGNGGFIETSAATVKVDSTASIKAAAQNGKSGTWLIDPTDFTIAASGGDITGAQLSSNLAGINVTIQSTSGAGGTVGDINVNDVVSWSANKLTLNALNNINVNANMNGSGTASLALEYGQAAVASGNTSTYKLASGVKIALPTGNNLTTKKGSNGSVTSFYVINSLGAEGSSTTTDLQGMRAGVTGNYALGSDIDASVTSTWQSGQGFTFIGTQGNAFTGNFEGLGHSIDSLFENWAIGYVGLFGKIDSTARVANVHLTNVNVSGGLDNVGGLVGYNNKGLIEHVTVQGKVSGGNNNTGGVVGFNDGTVTDAHAINIAVTGKNYATGGLIGKQSTNGLTTLSDSSGSASGFYDVGGLMGSSVTDLDGLHSSVTVTVTGGESGGLVGRANGKISNSYATGKVSAPGGSQIGGLVGQADGAISNSYATGDVTGKGGYTGGLAGQANSSISNSHATGKVDGAHLVGGLVGWMKASASISDSYATGDVTGSLYSVGGLAGSVGGSLTNTYATGKVHSSTDAVGGLVGSWSSGNAPEMKDSYATGNVSGRYAVGGLVGDMSACYCFVKASHATGQITGTADYIGGLVGYVDLGEIIDSWASGEISGVNVVGGLAGQGVNITNSYATGNVSGATNIGGLVGLEKMGGTVTSASYAIGNVIGTDTAAGGLVGRNEGTVTGDSYSTSLVQGATSVGGLIGENYGTVSDAETGHGVTPGPVVTGATGTGGLIGYNNGSVTNGVATGAVTGTSDYTGGLIGFNDTSGSVSGSKASGLVSGKNVVGGLIGENDGKLASSSFDTATVNGVSQVGGLVGFNAASGTINGASYTVQDVTGTGNEVGGLVGHNRGTVGGGSYANGVVGGVNQVGGLIGYNKSGTLDTVSAGVGSVSGKNEVGGLIGFLESGTVTKSSAAGAVTGNEQVGGFAGHIGSGKSTITSNAASGAVSAASVAGGFVGLNENVLSGNASNGNTTSSSVTVSVGQAGGFAGTNSGTLTDMSSTNDITITSAVQDVGGIVGLNSGTLQNSHAANTVLASLANNVGGAVGRNSTTGVVTKTYADNKVTGGDATGGLIGANDGSVSVAYASGTVSGNNNVGGLIGRQGGSGTAANVYAVASASGIDHVGGLIGYGGGSVSYTYATGAVSGSGSHTGGLLGSTNGANVSNSVFSIDGTGRSHSTGDFGSGEVAAGKTAAEMKLASTYAGWDLSTTGSHDKIWRSYDGLAAPLLVNWLTVFTVNATGSSASHVYDGTTRSLAASNVTYSGTPDLDLLLGTSSLSGKNVGVYSGASYYSIQQGYDIVATSDFTLTITPAQLTASVADMSRVYDGTTAASLAAGQLVLTGFVAGESATSKTLTGSYNSKDVATANTVTFGLSGSDLNLGTGTLLSNYNLPATVTGTGTITRAALGATMAPVSKVYDGSASIVIDPGAVTLSGFVNTEGANVTGVTASFNSKNVVDATTVTASVTNATAIGSTDLNNYTLPTNFTANGTITPKSLTVGIASATDKVYDGKVDAQVQLSTSGVVDGDNVSFSGTGSFADKNVGQNKLVTLTDLLASGADVANYTYNQSATAQANITQRELTVSLQGRVSKRIDGNTGATLSSGNYNVGNLVAGEAVAINQTVGQFGDALAGNNKQVTTTLAAADYAADANTELSNYRLVEGTLSGTIGEIIAAAPIIETTNATANLSGVTGTAGRISLPQAFNGVLATSSGGQQVTGIASATGMVKTTASNSPVADPLSPAEPSTVSVNTRENLLFRRAFSIGDGGIRLPQGVRGSEKDASE